MNYKIECAKRIEFKFFNFRIMNEEEAYLRLAHSIRVYKLLSSKPNFHMTVYKTLFKTYQLFIAFLCKPIFSVEGHKEVNKVICLHY